MSTKIFEEVPNLPKTEPAPPSIQTEEFRKVVLSRRSVRVFEAEPIPESVVRDCLELGLLAPNSSNLQAWQFLWVRSPEKKAALVSACMSQPAAKTAADLIVCLALPNLWKPHAKEMVQIFEAQGPGVPKSAIDYYAKLAPFIYFQGPLSIWGRIKQIIFAIRGMTKPTPREPISNADMLTWATKSCALACENIMLAFRAHGYDTCPLEGFDSSRVKQIFNLGCEASIVMVIAAGKRSPKGIYGPRLRFDSSRFIKEV